jgi:Protein of unknown function (DUF2726)
MHALGVLISSCWYLSNIGVILNISLFLALCLGLVAGAVVGAGLHAWWRHALANAKMRMPDKWPLTSRVLLTNEEHEVFKWLRTTFHDHLVMVKVPVLRFTVPISKDKNGGGSRWQEMLGGVYCTFTVCTANGNVVGCVDVPGKRGLNKSNRDLKEALLSECRIAYTVARSVKLPKSSAMRAAFLGELELDDAQDADITRAGNSSFHADLDNFTKEKRVAAKAAALKELNENEPLKPIPRPQAAGFNADGTGAVGSGKSTLIPNKWDDSFIQPDESRPAKLNQL